MAISLSFSLSMFNRAAARDFFSGDFDLDRSLADRERRRLDRDVRLWLRDREHLDDWRGRWGGDGDQQDFDVRLCCDSWRRDGDAGLFESRDFEWLLFDLQQPWTTTHQYPLIK